MTLPLEQRKRETRRITLWGVAVNLFLAVIKVGGGIIGQSQALLADGIHSLSDLASDGLVLVANAKAHKAADDSHPYGHQRYETLATLALSLLLVSAAVGICLDAYYRLTSPGPAAVPAYFTLLIAAISILSNEGLYHATRRVARRIESPMLHANAWHHRSDAVSSVVVLVGVGATLSGYPVFDAIAAIIVALMILKIALELGFKSSQELIDRSLEPEMVASVRQTILDVDGVKHLHLLRSRRMGHTALIDVHIQVAPRISISEGHHIAESVESAVIDRFDEINDVTVHIDPENDEDTAKCKHLPVRSDILAGLQDAWRDHPAFSQIDDVMLHYLDGGISVNASLPLTIASDTQALKALQAEFAGQTSSIADIREFRLVFY